MNSDLVAYYRDRAKEYEKIYSKPERQADLLAATVKLQHLFAGLDLLEIACGTGYWTEKIAVSARSVLATDINAEVIEIARQKKFPHNNVSLEVQDLHKINSDVKFDGVFGGFIWSHIPVEQLGSFVDTIHQHVEKDGLVVFMDNCYVEGSNIPISETDTSGNTYQTRFLADGTEHKVMKNFPTKEFLLNVVGEKGEEFSFIQLEYFWILSYRAV